VGEWVYRPVIGVATAVFRVIDLRFTLSGTEHIPREGGAVLAINHVSYPDFLFAGFAALERDRLVRFMAKKAVFDHRISGPLMRGMRHIPVDRTAGRDAYAAAVTALRSGEIVGMFPEQTIARSFTLRPFKTGAARLALESGVPLIPVVTWGGHRLWTSGHKPSIRRHMPVSVSVGEPILAASDESPERLTKHLRDTMSGMLDTVQREFVDAHLGAGAWWQPQHLGGGALSADEVATIEAARVGEPRPAQPE
jgi:1-acyl-sn-glycerol-3-phosphate acyltransferase